MTEFYNSIRKSVYLFEFVKKKKTFNSLLIDNSIILDGNCATKIIVLAFHYLVLIYMIFFVCFMIN